MKEKIIEILTSYVDRGVTDLFPYIDADAMNLNKIAENILDLVKTNISERSVQMPVRNASDVASGEHYWDNCPCCGAEPDIIRIGNEHTIKIKVKCPKCGLERTDASIYHGFPWLEEVSQKKWNRRVLLPHNIGRKLAKIEGWVETGISLIEVNNTEAIEILSKARSELYKTWNQKKHNVAGYGSLDGLRPAKEGT